MSVIYNTVAQHLNVTVSSGAITGTVIYFTIPWHPASLIDRVRIWNSNQDTKNYTELAIMNNGAHVRSGNVATLDNMLYVDTSTKTVSASTLYTATWAFNPAVYHEDLYCRPYLHVRVTVQSSVTNTTYFCNVVGRKQYPASIVNTDATQLLKNDDYRVLIGQGQSGAGGTGGTIYDVTGLAKGNGGENKNFFKLTSTNDYIYVGSKQKIDHFEFQIGTGSTILSGTGSTLQASIWNGSAWSSVNVDDNTSTGNVDTLKFTGLVETIGVGSSTWSPVVFRYSDNTLLPNDPLTVQQDRIANGGYPIIVLPPNPPRYWTRFKASTYLSDIVFNKILPVVDVY